MYVRDMGSRVKALRWYTAEALHQIQLLSCDYAELATWHASDHTAPFWRLYWHDRPGAEIVVANETIPLDPGKLVLIPPNTRFSSMTRRTVGQFLLHFRFEPAFIGNPGRIIQLKAGSRVTGVCREIVGQLRAEASGLSVSLRSHELIASVLRSIPNHQWSPRFVDSRMTEAVATIRARYPTRVPNRELAGSVGLGLRAFLRVFRRCTGRSPGVYLRDLRIDESCVLLHNSPTSLEEIAERTGFFDRAHFARVFSRQMNCPPARYRRMVNTDQQIRPGASRRS